MNEGVVSSAAEFDRHYAAEQVRRSRHPLRRIVKGFYLREVLRDVVGPSIDFGCGASQSSSVFLPAQLGSRSTFTSSTRCERGG